MAGGNWRTQRSNESEIDQRCKPRYWESIVGEHVCHDAPLGMRRDGWPQEVSEEFGEWTTPCEPISNRIEDNLTIHQHLFFREQEKNKRTNNHKSISPIVPTRQLLIDWLLPRIAYLSKSPIVTSIRSIVSSVRFGNLLKREIRTILEICHLPCRPEHILEELTIEGKHCVLRMEQLKRQPSSVDDKMTYHHHWRLWKRYWFEASR